MAERQMKLGALTHGVGITPWMWKQEKLAPNASTDFNFYKNLVQLCESAAFDFFFLTDSPVADYNSAPHVLNKFEPISVLSALAAVTEKIGLVATASTSFCEPYNLARQIATLDNLSGGRAGWNVVTTGNAEAAPNFGREDHYSHAERYKRASEFIEIMRGLWDSWEDDAFLYDKAARKFFDPNKLHRLNYKGEYFQVRGPLDMKRSPQGQPVCFQAGASADGQAYAARYADAIFSGTRAFKEAQTYYANVKRMAREDFGRTEDIVVMAAIGPVIGSTEEEAERAYRAMCDLVSLEDSLGYLGYTFGGHDFAQYDPDAPFPDLDETVGSEAYKSTAIRFKKLARERNLTLRQLALRVALPRPQFCGTPEKIADMLSEWFEGRAADGFILGLGTPVDGHALFIAHVVPILRARGLFRTGYTARTLRGHLGLPIPENVHTARRRKQAAE